MEPKDRLELADVFNHAWMKDQLPNLPKLKKKMSKRKKNLERQFDDKIDFTMIKK